MSEKQDREFQDWAKAVLDDREAGVGVTTLSRLRRARSEAIREKQSRLFFGQPRGPLYAGLTAGIAGLLVAGLWLTAPDEAALPLPGPEDLEIISADDDLDMYDELEFYRWLESSDEPAAEYTRSEVQVNR